jgi:hypothetical protein
VQVLTTAVKGGVPRALRHDVRLAFAIAFASRRAYALAGCAGLAMLGLLVWSGSFLEYYPSTGWELDASLTDRVIVLAVGVLFGMLVPLEVAAIAKARGAARAAGAGGVLGPLFGILSMSCCAPLLAPALLSFIGFSGSTLLNVNATLHELSTPLTLASLVLLVLSIGLVSHSIAAACQLPLLDRGVSSRLTSTTP